MSEPISRPVSPVTDSGDRSSAEWESTITKEQGELATKHHLSALSIEIDESLDKHCNPIRLQFVRQTSTTSSTDPLLPSVDSSRPLPTLFDQLGSWNVVVIVFGSLYAIFLLGFLWFLWKGHGGIPFWRWLVAQGYVQRAVTLCSALLRIIVAVQSSLGSSMLTALIMETMGFRLKQSAFLSLQRAVGGLPFMLLETRLFLGRAKILSALTLLLSCTTIGGLFTSTALIADFELVSILGYPAELQSLYSLKNVSAVGIEPVYSNYRPASYPAFAEYSSSIEPATTDTNQAPVDDTGPTLRAILPVDADVRQNLGTYTGAGTLLNSHVVCVKPIIHNLMFVLTKDSPGTFKPIINGSISLQAQPGGVEFDEVAGPDALADFPYAGSRWGADQSVNFSCQMTGHSSMATGEWPISMCVAGNTLNYTNGALHDMGRLAILGTRATSLLDDNILFDPLSYVMINYSGTLPEVYDPSKPPLISGTDWSELTSNPSTWRTYHQNNQSNYSNLKYVSISYCLPHFAAIDAQISVNSSSPRVEPTLRRSNTSSTPFDASDVLRQLGADGVKRTFNDRGILSLSKDANSPSYSDTRTSLALDGSYGFGMQRNSFSPPRRGRFFSASIWQPRYRTPGLIYGCQHDAVLRLLLGRLPQFDLNSTTSISTFTPTIQPKHRMGLLFVTVGLLIHIATMIAITLLFHFRTKNSFIGQSWHTVAQLQNENAIPILEKASLMRDREVEMMMREEGIDRNEVFSIGDAVELEDGEDYKNSVRRRVIERTSNVKG
ncbi:hypothetical protein BDZ45DRAFT_699352 [Acephala macrosclerotiorum]|nr:hypothetical protein BDZ45DRAFT_699352 [Acephala macrosclerotiorum]